MTKQSVLIIDDEPQIRKLLEITLESHGFKPIIAEDGARGISMAHSHFPDLVLLDLGLPDKHGHMVLEELKKFLSRPVIILSVINSEQDIVKALDNGAHDYLTKPFRTAELMARIRSALRLNTAPDVTIQVFGDLELDFEGRTVRKSGQILKLTATEFNMLALLAKNQGRVLTHQFLLTELWGRTFQNETQYLRVFVGTLRKKIEKDPNHPKHIITENRVGYRFH